MAMNIALWDSDFQAELAALRMRLLPIAGGAAGRHVVLPLQGSGHFTVEACIRSLVPLGARF